MNSDVKTRTHFLKVCEALGIHRDKVDIFVVRILAYGSSSSLLFYY